MNFVFPTKGGSKASKGEIRNYFRGILFYNCVYYNTEYKKAT